MDQGKNMQQLISEKQARTITGGRKPLLPVEYERACQALAECLTLDEAKYWANKADALAAWARIYHDDKCQRDAKALKLLAYRRMGEIASELRPGKRVAFGRGYGNFSGSAPGQNALLREQGLTKEQSRHVQGIAKIDKPIFDQAVSSKKPPAPTTLIRNALGENPEWQQFSHALSAVLMQCRRIDAALLAKSLSDNLHELSRSRALEVITWLDEFERHLPKGPSS